MKGGKIVEVPVVRIILGGGLLSFLEGEGRVNCGGWTS